MGFGTTLGGMGYAAEGAADMATKLGNLRSQHQAQEQNAIMLRRQHEQDQDRANAARQMEESYRDFSMGQAPSASGPSEYPMAQQPAQAKPPVVENGALQRVGTNSAGGAVEAQQIYRRMRDADQAKLDALQAPQATPFQYQNAAATQERQQQISQLQDNVSGYQRGYDAAGKVSAMQPTASVVTPLTATEKAAAKSNPNVALFAQQYGPAAQQVGQKLGVDPNIILAQWGMETGWGKSVIPGTNNLGNIKDFSGKGTTAKDNATGSTDKYRQYADVGQFGSDFSSLVQRKYPGAVGAGSDVSKYASGLNGYAEDPAYQSKIAAAYGMLQRAGSQGPAAQTGIPQTMAQAATPAAQQPFDVSGMEGITGQGYNDPTAASRQHEFEMARIAFQTSHDPQAKAAAIQKMDQLRLAEHGAQLQHAMIRAGTAQDAGSMNMLVGALSQSMGGQPLHVVKTGDGNLALLNQKGETLAAGSWASLAKTLHDNVSVVQQQRQAELANLSKTEHAKSYAVESGKTEAQMPLEQAKALFRKDQSLAEMSIAQQDKIAEYLMKRGLEARETDKLSLTQDGQTAVVTRKDGQIEYIKLPSGIVDPKVPKAAVTSQVVRPGLSAIDPSRLGDAKITGDRG